jgi:hypothetical protein
MVKVKQPPVLLESELTTLIRSYLMAAGTKFHQYPFLKERTAEKK